MSEPREQKLTYVEAVNAALDRALAQRDDVVVFGEDVGRPGGVFGATKGLQRRYGRRVFDTPISESAILGGAVGAAMMGRRPVAEIMWTDFSLVALDQLVNQAANVRYVSEGRLSAPLTVRMQQGRLPGSCAQHSQCLEAFFAHIPGLRVALPSTAQDAYDLLLAGIWCDDPVIVIEARGLYFGAKDVVVTDGPVQAVGGARVVRPGRDLSVATWSTMLAPVLAAAEQLAGDGIEAEVIDVRWLNPLDADMIADSVRRTHRLAVVHEANRTGGFGAEIAARVGHEAFFHLEAPIARIGAPDVRMPSAPHLQEALLPSADQIAGTLRQLRATN